MIFRQVVEEARVFNDDTDWNGAEARERLELLCLVSKATLGAGTQKVGFTLEDGSTWGKRDVQFVDMLEEMDELDLATTVLDCNPIFRRVERYLRLGALIHTLDVDCDICNTLDEYFEPAARCFARLVEACPNLERVTFRKGCSSLELDRLLQAIGSSGVQLRSLAIEDVACDAEQLEALLLAQTKLEGLDIAVPNLFRQRPFTTPLRSLKLGRYDHAPDVELANFARASRDTLLHLHIPSSPSIPSTSPPTPSSLPSTSTSPTTGTPTRSTWTTLTKSRPSFAWLPLPSPPSPFAADILNPSRER